MNELAITQIWMAGVVGMMLVFGATALFGYVKLYRRKTKTQELDHG